MTKVETEDQTKDVERLKSLLEKAKHTVYTSLECVSRSGMSRRINCYISVDSEIISINWYVALFGHKRHKQTGAIKVSGCGMDMGFHLVNSLSIALYCNGKYTHEGAYKLTHHWI